MPRSYSCSPKTSTIYQVTWSPEAEEVVSCIFLLHLRDSRAYAPGLSFWVLPVWNSGDGWPLCTLHIYLLFKMFFFLSFIYLFWSLERRLSVQSIYCFYRGPQLILSTHTGWITIAQYITSSPGVSDAFFCLLQVSIHLCVYLHSDIHINKILKH